MKSISGSYIFLSILAIAIVTGLIYLLSNRMNWNETYNMNSVQPYGTDVISKLLESKSHRKFHVLAQPGDSTLRQFISNEKKNYVFIGKNYYTDSNDIRELFEFIARGNNAFISSAWFPDKIGNLFETLYIDTADKGLRSEYTKKFSEITESKARLNFTGNYKTINDFILHFSYEGIQMDYTWNYIDSSIFKNENSNIFVLGTMNKKINFVRIEYGRGNLFLHLTPLAFTNYAIVDTNGRDYAERCFSVLNDGDIIWDEYNKLPKYTHSKSDGRKNSLSPLKFILSRESLRWAWYLTLFLLVIYAIFIGKRRQRIIPVIEPNKNTSLEYAKTVGKLYFLERNNRSVGIHKMKHFQSFLRNRYFILTNQRNQEMIDKLSMVSGVNKDLVSDIYNQSALINAASELTDEELIKFHISLTKFYKECI
jgi:hypothetical protein